MARTPKEITNRSLIDPKFVAKLFSFDPNEGVRWTVRVLLPILLPFFSVSIALFLTVKATPYLTVGPLSAFFIAILLSAFYGGALSGVLAIILSVFAVSYFVITPYVVLPGDFVPLLGFLGASFVALVLIELRRRNLVNLQQQRELLRVTLASIGDGVIVTDGKGHVVFINEVAESLTGYSAAEARGKKFLSVFKAIKERTRRVIEDPVVRVLRDGKVIGLGNHTILIGKDGREFFIDDSAAPISDSRGNIIGVVVIFRDVSERKFEEARERFLAETSKRLLNSIDYKRTLRLIAKLAVPYIADWFAIDVVNEEGKLERLSLTHIDPKKLEWAKELSKKYPTDQNAKTGVAYVIKTGKTAYYPEITDELLSKTVRSEEQLQLLKKVGMKSVMIAPLCVHQKAFGAMTFVSAESGHSYTRRDLEFAKELASRATFAIHNVRLFKETQQAVLARDQFLSIASHELKTPLTSMLLQTQGILRNIKKQSLATFSVEKMIKMLESVEQQSVRLAKLINDLLNVSLISSGRLELTLEEVDLAKLLSEVVSRFDEQLKQGGYTVSVEGEKSVEGLWDRLRLEQVLSNLLSNAIKYGRGKPIAIIVTQSENEAGVIVADHGIGIKPGQREKIFDLFKRAVSSENYGGLGIGLYIAGKIIDSHGGTIAVVSKVNEGTTFTVKLPKRPKKIA